MAKVRKSGKVVTASPLTCNHANERPKICPCYDVCYCKSHACRQIQPKRRGKFNSLQRQRAINARQRKQLTSQREIIKRLVNSLYDLWNVTEKCGLCLNHEAVEAASKLLDAIPKEHLE